MTIQTIKDHAKLQEATQFFKVTLIYTVAWFKINVRYTCRSPSYSLNIAITKAGRASQQFAVMVLQNVWKVFHSFLLPPPFETINLDFLHFSTDSTIF